MRPANDLGPSHAREPVAAPSLRRLSPDLLAALGRGAFPVLEALDLWLGNFQHQPRVGTATGRCMREAEGDETTDGRERQGGGGCRAAHLTVNRRPCPQASPYSRYRSTSSSFAVSTADTSPGGGEVGARVPPA